MPQCAPSPFSLSPLASLPPTSKERGFTLVELLVALSIFSILMTALVIIFVGALRTTQTGYQQMDAFERARSALNVIEDDLVRSYISHQSADLHSFYGTPIGMTFIGVTKVASDEDTERNIARITYVVYNYNEMPEEDLPEELRVPFEVLDEELREVVGYEYPYPLLRYVEPRVPDLDSFPINWDSTTVLLPNSTTTTWVDTGVNFRQLLDALCGFSSTSTDLTKSQEETVRAKKCEIWIRMLAGGDQQIPVNFWRDVLGYGKTNEDKDKVYQDYVVTENVICMSPYAWPERVPSDKLPPNGIDDDGDGVTDEGPGDPAGMSETNATNGIDDDGDGCIDDSWTSATPDGRLANPFYGFTPFFDYKTYARNSSGHWWNEFPMIEQRNWGGQWLPGEENRRDPRLPEVVTASFWLMFSSPYPGAPDFQRRFTLEIQVPTGYTRTVNPDLGY